MIYIYIKEIFFKSMHQPNTLFYMKLIVEVFVNVVLRTESF